MHKEFLGDKVYVVFNEYEDELVEKLSKLDIIYKEDTDTKDKYEEDEI